MASILPVPVKNITPPAKGIQLIFQDPFASLNPRLTVGQAIIEPMAIHQLYQNEKQRKEQVLILLEKVGLSAAHYNRYPHEFSGGQRQRIGIARTIAVQPRFIVCDESVSALDLSVQAQVLNLLNDLKDEFDFGYLFISHDLSVVRYFCDRIMVMKDGRIVETAEADQLYTNPQKEYTKQLIQDSDHGH
jgi:ATPase components of various ABC-type transport systems, contain duplicated ATPase